LLWCQIFEEEDERHTNCLVLHAHICERLGRFTDGGKSYKKALQVARKNIGEGRWTAEGVAPLKEAAGRLFILEGARKESHEERQKAFDQLYHGKKKKPLWTPRTYVRTENTRELEKDRERRDRQREADFHLKKVKVLQLKPGSADRVRAEKELEEWEEAMEAMEDRRDQEVRQRSVSPSRQYALDEMEASKAKKKEAQEERDAAKKEEMRKQKEVRRCEEPLSPKPPVPKPDLGK